MQPPLKKRRVGDAPAAPSAARSRSGKYYPQKKRPKQKVEQPPIEIIPVPHFEVPLTSLQTSVQTTSLEGANSRPAPPSNAPESAFPLIASNSAAARGAASPRRARRIQDPMIPPSGTPRDYPLHHDMQGKDLNCDILLCIMEYMNTPKDILNVGRVSKKLRALVRFSMDPAFKRVRRYGLSTPIPDPPSCLGFTEYTYACFIFNPGKCDNCKVETNQIYTSFAIPLRLCSKPECRKAITRNRGCLVSESRPDPNTAPPIFTKILLRIESDECVYKHPINPLDYPNATHWLHKERYGALKDEYVTSWNAPFLTEEFEAKYAKDVQEYEEKMQFFLALFRWSKDHYLKEVSKYKVLNKGHATEHAKEHGLTSHELLNTNTYGALNRIRTARFEEVTSADWALVMDQVLDKELAAITEKRVRRDAVVESQDLHMQTKVYWGKVQKSGELGHLPTLYQFKRLTTLHDILQPKLASSTKSPSDARVKPKKAESLEVQLAGRHRTLHADLNNFRNSTRQALMKVLELTWTTTASKTIVNPVERVTGLFRCKACDAKTLNGLLKDPLDFKHVCCHDCPAAEPAWRGKSIFNRANYEKDEKAIEAVSKVLLALGLDAERVTTVDAFKDVGVRVKCVTCAAPHAIIMDVQAVAGHARRHDNMVLEVLDEEVARATMNAFVGEVEVGLVARVPVTLLNPSPSLPVEVSKTRAKGKWREIFAFGCRHCEKKPGDYEEFDDRAKLKASFVNHSHSTEDVEMGEMPETAVEAEELEEGEIDETVKNQYKRKGKKSKGLRERNPKPELNDEGKPVYKRVWKHYNFDGVRSHLKKTHDINLARDEDLYFDWAQCEKLGYQNPSLMQTEEKDDDDEE